LFIEKIRSKFRTLFLTIFFRILENMQFSWQKLIFFCFLRITFTVCIKIEIFGQKKNKNLGKIQNFGDKSKFCVKYFWQEFRPFSKQNFFSSIVNFAKNFVIWPKILTFNFVFEHRFSTKIWILVLIKLLILTRFRFWQNFDFAKISISPKFPFHQNFDLYFLAK